MKKIISLVLLLCLSLSFVSFSATAEENETIANSVIYLLPTGANFTEKTTNTAVTASDINDLQREEVLSAPYIVVDFDAINDEEVLNYVSNLINVGKIIFIRADSHTANVSLIKNLLGYSQLNDGQLYETSPAALMERINTFGFIVYLDSNQHLQIVRQSADYVTLTDEVPAMDITDYIVEQVVISEAK